MSIANTIFQRIIYVHKNFKYIIMTNVGTISYMIKSVCNNCETSKYFLLLRIQNCMISNYL